ncbi:IclR family transcriptional regulator [Leucobacter denitrificans]|uniref:IclR family transcriptional regulator n=1 Tax=Leucobacter denitrificans TaxID=683042 RepID=A0A7G9S389_9MICO|nr:IclR family transcriptional regulator [Leucobacter denitrificans]
MQTSRAKGVDSARRVLQILLSFSESSPEVTVESISTQFGISVPSAYRYISLLRELYLIEETGRGAYSLTPQMFRLASVAESSIDIGNLGMPVVNRLVGETHETVLILRRIGDSAVCVASSQPDKQATISFLQGHLMPLHRGAGSKVLLAATQIEEQRKYLAHLEERLGPDWGEELKSELSAIRKQHFAISSAEVDEGIYAVAAPIVVEGRTVAALSIAGLEFRLSEERRGELLQKVREGAREISDMMSIPQVVA